jgi:Predicted membrane protein
MEIGLGTLGNVILIGIFMDLIVYAKLIPKSTNLFSGLIMLIASLFIMAMGTYLYISSEIGCGPRDGLMVVLVRITQKPVGIVRFVIESSVLIVGYILGGTVGVGTVITTFGLAYCTGLVFRIFQV